MILLGILKLLCYIQYINMKAAGVLIFIGVVIVGLFLLFGRPQAPGKQATSQIQTVISPPPALSLSLTSSLLGNGQPIPKNFTCDGDNISPPLTISNVPEGTKSLALTLDDLDAPAGTFTHWLVWNIPPTTTEIAQGKIPSGTFEGINDTGKPGYFGPCPPSVTHRYVFTLYALDGTFSLPPQSKKGDLLTALSGHVLAQTQLTGVYSRQ